VTLVTLAAGGLEELCARGVILRFVSGLLAAMAIVLLAPGICRPVVLLKNQS